MQKSGNRRVLVIGAGLAGSEAAMFLAKNGVHVVLMEGKTLKLNPAQKIPNFAELVCTNSLKSLDPYSAHGLLKSEMKALGSFIIESAEKHAVPAGDALAVDRENFSAEITNQLRSHPLIRVVDMEADDPIKLKAEFNAILLSLQLVLSQRRNLKTGFLKKFRVMIFISTMPLLQL